ncbi:unnamed protein product [Camellia sinensis]
MARKGSQQKNGLDRNSSSNKKGVSDSGCALPNTKKRGKVSQGKVVGGEELPNGNHPSVPSSESVNETDHIGDENKSKQKSRKLMRKEKQGMSVTQGVEQPVPCDSNSGDSVENLPTMEASGSRDENGTPPNSNHGSMYSKSSFGHTPNGLHTDDTMGNFESDTVVGHLSASALSIFKGATEWLERQKPLFITLTANMSNAACFVRKKVEHAYPIVLRWLMYFGNIMLLLSMVWLDSALRGIDSFLHMGTTSFFSIIWCSILSIIAMIGMFKFAVVLVVTALVGLLVGFTIAILLIGISGIVFLWFCGSFWTTGLVICSGGLAFMLSHERLALLITTSYSIYCAWTYVGWLGLLLALNLSFISSDALIYFLKNNMNEHRRPHRATEQTAGKQGQSGFFYSEPEFSCPETGSGPSADRSPGIPSTSGTDSEITSEDEVVRLLNCTDHYSVLGLSRYENVDVSILKREYRKKAMLVHPDKNMGNEKAVEAFKKLQNAYEVLLDSLKRKEYDDELRREDLLNCFRRIFAKSEKNVCQTRKLNDGGAIIQLYIELNDGTWVLLLGLLNDIHHDLSSELMEGISSLPLDLRAQTLMVRTLLWRQDRFPVESVEIFISGFTPKNQNLQPDGASTDCKDFHQAKDGDGWLEQSSQPLLFGILQKVDPPRAYVCADGKIYDATEWYICQGMRCPANSHKPSFHVNPSLTAKHNNGKGTSSGQRGGAMPSSNLEEGMTEEEFFEWLQNAAQAGMFDDFPGSTSSESPSTRPGNFSKSAGSSSGSKRKKKGKKQW